MYVEFCKHVNNISQVNTKRGNSVEKFRSTTLNQKNTFVNFTNRT